MNQSLKWLLSGSLSDAIVFIMSFLGPFYSIRCPRVGLIFRVFPGRSWSVLVLALAVIWPTNTFASFYAGKQALAAHQYKRAQELFRKAIEKNPRDGNSCFYLGYIAENERRYRDSVTWFEKAVNRDIKSKLRKYSYIKIINYYKFQKDWERVYQYAGQALRYTKNKNIQKLRDKAAGLRDPRAAKAQDQYRQGLNAYKKKDYAGAVGFLSQAVRLDPGLNKARVKLGYSLHEIGDYRASLPHWRHIVEKVPENPVFQFKLGLSYLKTSQAEAARTHLKKAGEKARRSNLKYFVATALGQAELMAGNYQDAREYFRRARKLRPQSVSPRSGLAEINFHEKNYSRALALLKSIPETERAAMDWQILGVARSRAGDRTTGRADLIRMDKLLTARQEDGAAADHIREKKQFGLGYYYLGLAEARQEAFREAIIHFRKAVPPADQSRPYHFYFGKSLYYTGNFSEAESHLARVKNSAGGYFLLAKISSRRRDRNTTEEMIRRATKLKPNYWKIALKDPAFREMRQDPEFMAFLVHKGNPPQKEKFGGNQPDPFVKGGPGQTPYQAPQPVKKPTQPPLTSQDEGSQFFQD